MNALQDGLRELRKQAVKAAMSEEERKRLRNRKKRAKWRVKRKQAKRELRQQLGVQPLALAELLTDINKPVPFVDWAQGLVYVIINRKTKQEYVGATSTPLKLRWKYHREKAQQGSSRLHQAMRSTGYTHFSIIPIASCLRIEELAALEESIIRDRRPFYNDVYDVEDIWSQKWSMNRA